MKPKICFCALNAYPLLSGTNLGFTGGAEFQQVLLAKELVKRGFDLSFVVFDHGQEPFEIIDGIRIYKTVPKGYILSGVSSLYHAIKSVWNALKRAGAHIYCERGAGRGYDVGFVALFCLLKKKRLICSIANDDVAEGKYIKTLKLHQRVLYNFGLKRADCIIAQSEYQQELLKRNFNRDSIILKSLCPIETVEKSESDLIVLWVGTVRPEWKQPELFLKLAKAIPDAKFQMVGGGGTDKQFYEEIRGKAKRIPNLQFVGFVPYPDINKYFQNASILVNTSSIEGFPNTFIQAWSYYVPTVSLSVNPDGIISKLKLGFHSKTFDQLVRDVKTLLEDEQLCKEMGKNARQYVEREHDITKIADKYIEVFNHLWSG